MTILAGFFSMCTFQLIACQLVIELFRIEPDDFKSAAMMFVVAHATVFTLDFGRNMITFLSGDPGFKFGMTFQAFVIGYLLTQDMTLCAVLHPFQVSMIFGKVTWRYLGR